jgi:hypothetical protein
MLRRTMSSFNKDEVPDHFVGVDLQWRAFSPGRPWRRGAEAVLHSEIFLSRATFLEAVRPGALSRHRLLVSDNLGQAIEVAARCTRRCRRGLLLLQ